jgi:hypothetical protein
LGISPVFSWKRFWLAFYKHWEAKAAGAFILPLIAYVVTRRYLNDPHASTSLKVALISLMLYVGGTFIYYLAKTPFILHREHLATRTRELGESIKIFLASFPPKPTDRIEEIKRTTKIHDQFTSKFWEDACKIRHELREEAGINDEQLNKDLRAQGHTPGEIERIAGALINLSIELLVHQYRQRLLRRYKVADS